MKTYLLLFGLLLLVACSSNVDTNPTTNTPRVDTSGESSNTHQYTVRIIDNQPDLDLIEVAKGDLVALEVINQDNRTVLFSIENYEDAQVGAGASTLMIFKAHTQGTFNFGIRDAKEKGILVVE